MPYEVLNGPVIDEDEALSDALDLDGGSIVRITTPTAYPPAYQGWSGGPMTFQVSLDGGTTFVDLFRENDEVQLACGPARGVLYPVDWPESITHIKIRSGKAATPVKQLYRREFAIAVFKP